MKKKTEKIIIAVLMIVSIGISAVSGCFIRKITGIPCPGCGMTRAYTALTHGDIKQAFYFHPLFWIVPIFLILFFTKILSVDQKELMVLIILITSIVVWVIRLLTGTLV